MRFRRVRIQFYVIKWWKTFTYIQIIYIIDVINSIDIVFCEVLFFQLMMTIDSLNSEEKLFSGRSTQLIWPEMVQI